MPRKTRKTGGRRIGGVKGEYASPWHVVGIAKDGNFVVLERGSSFGTKFPESVVKKWKARGTHTGVRFEWLTTLHRR